MKMKNNLLVAALCGSLSLAGSAFAQQQPPAPYGPGPMMGPGPNMGPGPGPGPYGQQKGAMPMQGPSPFAGIEFSEKQRQRIQDMMAEQRQMHQQRQQKMFEAQQRLRELYNAEEWDADAITRVYDEIFAQQRETVRAMAEARNKVYEMMTKEQREQLRQQQEERKKRMEEMQQRAPMPRR